LHKIPIDETSDHFSTTFAQHYANCLSDHRFMGTEQMYTYQLVVEAWHQLLQLHFIFNDQPLLGVASAVDIPIVGHDQPS
jgi:hypothetical protein